MINAYINVVLHIVIQTDQLGVKREISTIWSLTTTQESAPSRVLPLVTSSIYYQKNALKTTSGWLTFVKGVCRQVKNLSSCSAQFKPAYPNIFCLPGSYCSWRTLVHGRGSRVLGWQYFCLLRGTSAKMGGQGGGRISLRLQQAKIEYDLFSFAAVNTFLSNNPSYSWQSLAQERQRLPSPRWWVLHKQVQTEGRRKERKCPLLTFLHSAILPKHHTSHSCSTCRALHILCICFAMMESSPYLGEALLYFNVMPYGVIKVNRKGYT